MSRKTLERLTGISALLLAAATLVVGLAVAPTDSIQGQPQRLMYVHVPAAWVAYLTFGTVLVASIMYLVRRDLRWDRRAQAAAELGVGLTALTIALGSIWGYPIWGVWWTWDPRLVTTGVLLLVYIGYLGVHGLAPDPAANARRAAVVGIVGFVNVPVVHFAVVWWRTLHQPPTVLRPDGPGVIEPAMLTALLLGLAAFTAATFWLYLRRLRVLAQRAAPPPAIATPGADSADPAPAIVVVPTRVRSSKERSS